MNENKLFNNIEQPQNLEKEKELNPEEIEQLGEEMDEYLKGLFERIKEIKRELKVRDNDEKAKELGEELEFLLEQYDGLHGFSDDIKESKFETITKKLI